MLPVAGKPILEWNLEALSACGVKKAVIVVGYCADVIKKHFGGKFKSIKLDYVTQTEQLGTAHAVATAEKKIFGDFLAMNGDVLIGEKDLKGLIASHEKSKNAASMCLTKVSDPSRYGVVTVKAAKVKSIEEKPEKPKSSLANAGAYVFSKDVFKLIKEVDKSERLEYELTDALTALIPQGVGAVVAKQRWLDVGMPWHLLDANEIMLNEMKLAVDKKAIVEDFTVMKGEVHVGAGTVIRSGAYIEGPAWIGEDCAIGPNCFIRPHSMIGSGCHIGNAVEIKNSIVMDKTSIGHLSYVGDSVIGEGCNFGAGTKVANLRFDDSEVRVEVKQRMEGSGRRKFGCLMGDGAKTGINVSIMPGRSIYPGAFVDAGSVVRNTIYTEE